MQYSLQHWTLLPSPVTSTAWYCFPFGSISAVLMELFLHSSPVAYWTHTDQGSSSFNFISFCLFILFMGFSRQEYWSGFPFPSPVDHIFSGTMFIYLLPCPKATLGHHQGTSDRNTLLQNCGFFLFVSQKIHVSAISLRLWFSLRRSKNIYLSSRVNGFSLPM